MRPSLSIPGGVHSCMHTTSSVSVLASRNFLLNIPLAFVALYVCYALYNHIVEQQRRQVDAELQRFLARFPNPEPPAASNGRQSSAPFGEDDWKQLVGCDELIRSWEEFVNLLTKDFVTDLFYSYMTPDDELPMQVASSLNNLLGELSLRTRHVNIASLLLKDVMALLEQHIDQFRRTVDAVGNKEWGGMSDEAQEQAFEAELRRMGSLHPAAASLEGDSVEFRNLQMISQGLVMKLIPVRDTSCAAMRIMLREILGTCVLKPVMDIFTPEYFNMVRCHENAPSHLEWIHLDDGPVDPPTVRSARRLLTVNCIRRHRWIQMEEEIHFEDRKD